MLWKQETDIWYFVSFQEIGIPLGRCIPIMKSWSKRYSNQGTCRSNSTVLCWFVPPLSPSTYKSKPATNLKRFQVLIIVPFVIRCLLFSYQKHFDNWLIIVHIIVLYLVNALCQYIRGVREPWFIFLVRHIWTSTTTRPSKPTCSILLKHTKKGYTWSYRNCPKCSQVTMVSYPYQVRDMIINNYLLLKVTCEVNIGEYSPRWSQGEYSPIFTEPEANI